MTTVVYKDGVMVGDGQVTRYDSLIESTNCVKVRNIGGTLVGGAGNGISIMKFFDWYADNVETAWAQSEYSNLNILPPEDLVEEDFQALVVSPDGSIFEYIGTKNIFPVTEEYAAIGSGCLYAYPLMDAGLSARESVEVCSSDTHGQVRVGRKIYEYRVCCEAKIQEGSRKSAHHIVSQLIPEMQEATAGVTADKANYITPFKLTMRRVVDNMEQDKWYKPAELLELVNSHGGHHYSKDSTFKNSIGSYLVQFKHCESNGEWNKSYRLLPKEGQC